METYFLMNRSNRYTMFESRASRAIGILGVGSVLTNIRETS